MANSTVKTFWVGLVALVFCGHLLPAQINPQFEAIDASFNVNSSDPIQALNVPYDVEDLNRQSFHLFLPDSTGTYPLLIFIHGGGFTSGTKDGVFTNPVLMAKVKYFLDRGMAFASLGYRLLNTTQQDSVGVKKCLFDSKRGLQFIRHHAQELHIDPEAIAIAGSSAGAGTGLWLATRDDMADPNASDLVLRESTRICALETSICQASYDLYKWETEVFQNFDGMGTNYTVDSMVIDLGFPLFSNFYGGLDSNYHFLYDLALIQYRQDVDMLFHMSSDDPPLYIANGSGAMHPSQDLYHHPFHGRVLQDAAIQASLPEVKADIQLLNINTTQGESSNDFLFRHLSACALSTSLDQAFPESELAVYPNPASSHITVALRRGEHLSDLELYSVAGKLVLKKEQIFSPTITVGTTALPPGLYILRASNRQGQHWTEKLLVE